MYYHLPFSADWKAYYAYLDYQDSAWRKAYLDYQYSEAANKYSKDKQDNGDTNEESDERSNYRHYLNTVAFQS